MRVPINMLEDKPSPVGTSSPGFKRGKQTVCLSYRICWAPGCTPGWAKSRGGPAAAPRSSPPPPRPLWPVQGQRPAAAPRPALRLRPPGRPRIFPPCAFSCGRSPRFYAGRRRGATQRRAHAQTRTDPAPICAEGREGPRELSIISFSKSERVFFTTRTVN